VSAPSFLMVMAMLALVLGAMGVAMRVLRKYAMTNSAAKGTVKMEIVQRLSLGQRQGLAVVRIGTRVLAVSMGDGGVHQVAELSDDDLAPSDGVKGVTSKARHSIAEGIFKLSLIRGNSGKEKPAAARSSRTDVERIPYIAPIEDFQAVLSMALGGGAHA
jgi:flagellar biogenesis protein FliO